jgi:RHH-type proline utilization regulon transcriptional repressor/proline dehydrogenase/delta 1-pyrroline-5-carboxylate dehydrogenase
MNRESPILQFETSTETRAALRRQYGVDEGAVVRELASRIGLDAERRRAVAAHGARIVERVRRETAPTMMEAFLAEYGLSTDEGIGLMCLAEALLRVPDAETIDDLIHDKIEPSDWSAHLGHSSSPMVNASTWALMLTGRVLDDDPKRPAQALRGLIRRMGEPVVRTAVSKSMKLLGRQFVLGETIADAMGNARPMEKKGYTYSYDMLGEAARTEADAIRYHQAYAKAIKAIAGAATGDVRSSPGISVKLSALHPRYEWTHRGAVMDELVPRALDLARQAAAARIGFNIDAEEQDRLELSLDVIEAVLSDAALVGWNGFGVVVQAYGRRAAQVIEHLHALAERLDRRIMVRLVKGAYWDTEIKQAQEAGVDDFPVFTRKANTDLSYMACARMLLDRRDRIYPQFATHNAHSCAAVLEMAGNDRDGFEFQRLHGMGESLHRIVHEGEGTRCRIYAPVGAHRDLLAYLVRRLLENGANSSFVNQIVDKKIPAEQVARDPVADVESLGDSIANPAIRRPPALLGARRNSRGFRINEPGSILPLLAERETFADARWRAAPMIAGGTSPKGPAREARSPSDPDRIVGEVHDATPEEVRAALDAAPSGFEQWSRTPVAERAAVLRRAADLYEERVAEFCALATREAGKILMDGVAEVREAVDFLRFYADEAERLEDERPGSARGVFVCISPWNFPLAIFSGQVAAALAAGNAVVAKPAEQTPLIAARAVELLRQAGVPEAALQLLPGDGPTVGGPLTSDPRIAGVCFTGSTEVAQIIHRALAENAGPDAVLIAETGGLNAMIVDTTALTEQAVRDIVASSFQSAGQRCSALRMLYVQDDARGRLLEMLHGAMDALVVGDPWDLATDVAPVIDAEAQRDISGYVAAADRDGRVLKRLSVPSEGFFAPPAVVKVSGIADLEREIFGPVLHVASFRARDIDVVVDAINARGYGLTFGLHTRIDDRVQQIVERIHVGNAYVNRNQIGAIVGCQPFGGEGLSGTGPKAGGPLYVDRFRRTEPSAEHHAPEGAAVVDAATLRRSIERLDARNWAARQDRVPALRRALAGGEGVVRKALSAVAAFDPGPFTLPGPTGESNRLSFHPKGVALCLGPTPAIATAQAAQALAAGCGAVVVVPGAAGATAPLVRAGMPIVALDGTPPPELLRAVEGIAVVAAAGASDWTRALRRALAAREGPIVPLETQVVCPARYVLERHVCIDTTAAGGNASLLASVA